MIISLHGLACLSAQQGRDKKAECLCQRGLRICEQSMGSERIETSNLLHDFASFQREHAKFQETISLYQHALQIRERVLGANHPETIATRTQMCATMVVESARGERIATQNVSSFADWT